MTYILAAEARDGSTVPASLAEAAVVGAAGLYKFTDGQSLSITSLELPSDFLLLLRTKIKMKMWEKKLLPRQR